MSDSHVRSIVKAVSYRLAGTLSTFLIAFVVTGRVDMSGAIAGIEAVSKISLFYLHERVWSNVKWGRKDVI